MLSYIQLSKKPKMFKTFTGLSIEEFDRLYQITESDLLSALKGGALNPTHLQ